MRLLRELFRHAPVQVTWTLMTMLGILIASRVA